MKGDDYFEGLLHRAKNGERLSNVELDEVKRQLERTSPTADPYTLLHILGKANDRTSQSIIMRYMSAGSRDPDDDGLVRRIAIQILGQWWCVLEAFPVIAKQAFEDPSPYVRMVAASSLGTLGRAHLEVRKDAAVALLRGIAEYDAELTDVWAAFYTGMLELLDVEQRLRPLPGTLKKREQLDPTVLDRVRTAALGS